MKCRCGIIFVEKSHGIAKGLRVLPIDNYLAFYLPVKATTTVVVVRIMYGGRDIEEQLRQMQAGG